MISLKGKAAFITGASRGIGKSIALTLADAGANIIATATNEKLLGEVVGEIQKKGAKAIFVRIDVSKYDEVEKAVERGTQEFGSIDILVNNAGVTRDNIAIRLKTEDWENVLNVNLIGTFNCIKAASKYMLRQKAGRIINISSISGIFGNPGQANYAASKAGVIALTKVVARELASRNIIVNCIAPGFIETDMMQSMEEKARNAAVEKIPLGRLGKPQDIANAVLFLSSDYANFITGQTLVVDGGIAM